MNTPLQTWTQHIIPSSLARTLDPRVPSNLMILVFAPLVALTIGVLHLSTGLPLLEAIINAAGAGAFTGLAWVIGRELDPDHNFTAYFAAILMAIALFIVDMPALMPLITIVVALRIVNRSTGLRPRLTDLLVLIGLAGVTVALDGFWLIGLMAALTFVLNAFLPDSNRTNNLTGAVVTLLLTVVINLFTAGNTPLNFMLDVPVALAAAISIAYLVIVLRAPNQLRSVGDYTDHPLLRQRVLAGQLLALVTVIAFVLWGGTPGVTALLPVWTSVIGVVMRGIVRHSD